jgi:hypothetical protein
MAALRELLTDAKVEDLLNTFAKLIGQVITDYAAADERTRAGTAAAVYDAAEGHGVGHAVCGAVRHAARCARPSRCWRRYGESGRRQRARALASAPTDAR